MTEIKCPYCDKKFEPEFKEKKSRSTAGNIAKGAVFLPWGVVSALKTKKSEEVVCPHCGMTVQSKEL